MFVLGKNFEEIVEDTVVSIVNNSICNLFEIALEMNNIEEAEKILSEYAVLISQGNNSFIKAIAWTSLNKTLAGSEPRIEATVVTFRNKEHKMKVVKN